MTKDILSNLLKRMKSASLQVENSVQSSHTLWVCCRIKSKKRSLLEPLDKLFTRRLASLKL